MSSKLSKNIESLWLLLVVFNGALDNENHCKHQELHQHRPQTVWAEINGLNNWHIALSRVHGCCAHDMLPTFYEQDFNGACVL